MYDGKAIANKCTEFVLRNLAIVPEDLIVMKLARYAGERINNVQVLIYLKQMVLVK